MGLIRELVKDQFKLISNREGPVRLWCEGDDYLEYWLQPEETYKSVEPQEVPAKVLAKYMDMEAENANESNMVGAHEWLEKNIQKVTGSEEMTRKIFLEIYRNGGLHDLTCL